MGVDLEALGTARELSPAERDELVKEAFELEREIKARKAAAHEAWWDLAESLYQLHEMRGWELLGYETLAEFLAQPEIGLSERSFHYAVRTWRDLAVVRKLPPSELKEVEPSKAREIVPAIMAGQVKAEDAIADAKQLSYRDVKEKYRPKNIARHGQQPDGSTPLDASREPKRVRCPTCGQWTTEDQLPDGEDA